MSTSSGPYAPEEGWQTRWVIQAAGLLVRSPVTIIIGILAMSFMGILESIVGSFTTGIWGYAARSPFTAAIAMLVPVLISASLAIHEGHGIADKDDIKKALFTLMKIVFLLEAVLVVVAIALTVNKVSLVSGVKLPDRSQIDLAMASGVAAVVSGMFTTLIFNPLWSVLVTQIPMDFSQIRMTGHQMIRKSFSAWSALIFVMMISSQATLLLPAPAGMAVMIFVCVWLYVAAREIFGGISSNSYSSEAAASPMEA
jgi:hypothetical protein